MKLLEELEQLFVTPALATNRKVVVRTAPSPTGNLHIGTARLALFNYLFARKHGGKIILRIEDTDTTRSKKEFEDDILESLRWLSLSHDEFYRQSERGSVYQKHLLRLIKEKKAYLSREPSQSNPAVEIEVVRLRNQNRIISFEDEIRGTISFDTMELGDFVIARSLSDALYHFAVVVDDVEMGVTHVIRGDDHISNTQRHILIQEALGAPRPVYAHIPLVLAPDHSKLSKRHGATAIREYREQGFLPEALINYLALLGWNPGTTQELFTLSELIKEFDLSQVHKSGAIFDIEKLRWFNREYLRRLPPAEALALIGNALPEAIKALPHFSEERLQKVAPLLIERIAVFSDIAKLVKEEELQYFFERPAVAPEDLAWKDTNAATIAEHLQYLCEKLGDIPEKMFTQDTVREAIFGYATEKGRGAVLWPMRYALSGKKQSPDPFVLSGIFGKEETIARLTAASATIAK